jgi:hypothetical protein
MVVKVKILKPTGLLTMAVFNSHGNHHSAQRHARGSDSEDLTDPTFLHFYVKTLQYAVAIPKTPAFT